MGAGGAGAAGRASGGSEAGGTMVAHAPVLVRHLKTA